MTMELAQAARALFGTRTNFSHAFFVQHLSTANLKRAFRKKALLTHPDLCSSTAGNSDPATASDFIAVRQAYEKLRDYIGKREKAHRNRFRASYNRRYSRKRQSAHVWQRRTSMRNTREARTGYKGPIPNWYMRFGEYLYYSGLISWNTLIQSLVWQRRVRPRFGEIAGRLRLLAEADISRIFKNKKARELFGDAAMRLNLLNQADVEHVMAQQKRFFKPIGEYYVKQKLMTPEQLYHHLAKLRRHNFSTQAQSKAN